MDRAFALILIAGVAVRLLFLFLAGNPQPFADESNYLTLALSWLRFGFYSDSGHFLWPPGYPFVLREALARGGVDGVFVVRLLQVLASGVIGLHVLHFAQSLGGARAARIAGLLWVFSFPLIEFTHSLWPETFFVALMLTGFRVLIGASGRPHRCAIAGVLFGCSLMLKESVLYLYALLPFVLALRHRDDFALPAALSVLLGCAVVVTPWMMRNQEYYGEPAVLGATLGENLYRRANANYRNLDYPAEDRLAIYSANRAVHDLLLRDTRPKWIRHRGNNVVRNDAVNVRTGMAFLSGDPVAFLGGRVKRVADFVSPHSFFVRHLAMGRHEHMQSPEVRRALAGLAVALALFTMASAVLGVGRIPKRAPALTTFVLALLYFALAVGALGGLTRYRIPLEPVLIVLAGLAWGGAGGIGGAWRASPRIARAALFVLLALWAVNAMEVLAVLGRMGATT